MFNIKAYFQRFSKQLLWGGVALFAAITFYIFMPAQLSYEECILKYAVTANSSIATSLLNDACYDLQNGTTQEKDIAKCHMEHVQNAHNADAVYLADSSCKELSKASKNLNNKEEN